MEIRVFLLSGQNEGRTHMFSKQITFALLFSIHLSFMLVADEVISWDKLSSQEGCLISATDINFSIEGSIFAKKEWQLFFETARKEEKIYCHVIERFTSQNPTKIHICNFRNATEGELAIFAAQQIIKKNWFSYNDYNEDIKIIAKKNVKPKALLLKDILSKKELCIALQDYFVKQYRLKLTQERKSVPIFKDKQE